MAIHAKRRGFLFDEVKINKPKFSAFDMSFENKLSSNLGDLVPTLCKEVLPGDTLELRSSSLVRFAPTLAPLLHNIDVMTYTFFVPNRLIWNEWEKFISPGAGSVTMVNQPSFVPPIAPFIFLPEIIRITSGNYSEINIQGSLADYLGIPDCNLSDRWTGNNGVRVSALPFRAYALIWNEYFRDQNLEQDIFDSNTRGFVSTNSGEVAAGSEVEQLMTLRKKSWEKDYFTSALPTPQRGAQVILPLGTEASVFSVGDNDLPLDGKFNMEILGQQIEPSANINYGPLGIKYSPNYGIIVHDDANREANLTTPYLSTDDGSLETSRSLSGGDIARLSQRLKVDLSSASSATVETLRNAFKLQEFLEKSARSGARYIENILAHFGEVSSDARLDRPELLGTSRNPVVVTPVEQNSDSTSQNSPTGTLYGKLTSSYKSDFIRYHAEEHGFIMQLQCVIPRTSYQQGLHRMWTRETYLDYAWPEFAHLGEQEVYNRELYNGFRPYFTGDGSANAVSQEYQDGIFGYQPRYSEYKYNSDEVHGDFKGNLRFWHMSRVFREAPTLSPSFIHSDPRMDVFAVTSENVHHLYQEIWHDFKMLRALPEYGTPHF